MKKDLTCIFSLLLTAQIMMIQDMLASHLNDILVVLEMNACSIRQKSKILQLVESYQLTKSQDLELSYFLTNEQKTQ